MGDRKQSWVAWAPHRDFAARADSEAQARKAACALESGPAFRATWKFLQSEGWRVTRVDDGGAKDG